MVTFNRSDELREAEFVGTDLTGARFVEADLSSVVMRGVDVQGADIDAPWLDGDGSLRVNGVNVAPFGSLNSWEYCSLAESRGAFGRDLPFRS